MGLVPLPSDDEVVKAWRRHDQNNTRTARALGVNESTIRKAVQRATGRKPRSYKRLPVGGRELYAEWLKDGAERSSVGRLAARYGVKPQTIRASMTRWLKREGLY
jgi:hypothetical protein